MIRRKTLFLILLFLSPSLLHSAVLRIGIFQGKRFSSAGILASSGIYEVYAGGKKIYNLTGSDFLQVSTENGGLKIHALDGGDLGTHPKIKIVGIAPSNSFRLKGITPYSDPFTFDDNLEMTPSGGFVQMVNVVDIEHYVEGVLESEIGKANGNEFLKSKAIICRTYALSHVKRHKDQGFHLCDQVHCQVYKGKPTFNFFIAPAVQATRGQVIVDNHLSLITAAFHSNCGGQTTNSEDVWSFSLPYLRSVKDTFCNSQPHAYWEMKVPVREWKSYLASRGGAASASAVAADFRYEPAERQTYFALGHDDSIHLKTIRSDWGFKSTYFSIEEVNDSLVIKGKGYGHGVGLCQEGAMKMAEHGFTCKEIINYYYRNVGIISLEALKFLTEE